MNYRRKDDEIIIRLETKVDTILKRLDDICGKGGTLEKHDERIRDVEKKQSAFHPVVTAINSFFTLIALYLGAKQ